MRPRPGARVRSGSRRSPHAACRGWPIVVLGVAALVVGGKADGQYLAVFVDGRILPVASAQLVGTDRMRLDLPGGGDIEVPLKRVDRVIADEIEPEVKPIEKPKCVPAFANEPLPPHTPFAAEIVAASRRANLNPRLVAAVVAVESDFRPLAVSRVGAFGLMQLMPSVWKERTLNPFDPAANLRVGCRHLRSLIDRFKDLGVALAAYNAGVAVVEHSGGMPAYRETREFVRAVLARFCPAG
jgi:hypothetical protein